VGCRAFSQRSIDGMRTPFCSHILHKIVSLYDKLVIRFKKFKLRPTTERLTLMSVWPYLFLSRQPCSSFVYLITTGNPGLATHLSPLSSLFDTLARQRRALQGVPPRRSGPIDEFHYFYSYLGFFSFAKQILLFIPPYSCRLLQFSPPVPNVLVRLSPTAVPAVTHFERPSLTWLWNSESVLVGPWKT